MKLPIMLRRTHERRLMAQKKGDAAWCLHWQERARRAEEGWPKIVREILVRLGAYRLSYEGPERVSVTLVFQTEFIARATNPEIDLLAEQFVWMLRDMRGKAGCVLSPKPAPWTDGTDPVPKEEA